ncbi:ABC transporter substrate-binding protein [Microlunatus parietis]|uniref:ABC transporter substrate-binding protein n=1 Tax=Microlunatus parietis TaxID=682979 RepID=UPI001FECEEB3|nr:ABC transporter substrate-binding protein [Microlunatus parietis]
MVTYRLSRRTFLHATAAAAGALALTSCTGGNNGPSGQDTAGGDSRANGSVTEPLPPPGSYQQAPSLDDAGLPRLRSGCPSVRTSSRTGGCSPASTAARWSCSHSRLAAWPRPVRTVSSATATRYCASSTTGRMSGPGLAESWESNDDASEWTFHFRKGLKWSDGQPWTTEDILRLRQRGHRPERCRLDDAEPLSEAIPSRNRYRRPGRLGHGRRPDGDEGRLASQPRMPDDAGLALQDVRQQFGGGARAQPVLLVRHAER